MSTLIAIFFGAVAAMSAAASVSTAFRSRLLRYVPLSRRTYMVWAVWFPLAVVIVIRERQMQHESVHRLRLAGAVLSVLSAGSVFLDYRRYKLSKAHETDVL